MNGMSEEIRNNIIRDLAAFQMDSNFDNSNTSELHPNDFDSAKNPFLESSPKKTSSSSTKLPFPKPAEMFMSTKNNRYDVFKDDFASNGLESVSKAASAATEVHEKKTEMSQDPFKDFAVAAFSEFKVDKSSSSLHEFSNKLFQQPNSNGHQRAATKVKKHKISHHYNHFHHLHQDHSFVCSFGATN